MRFILKYFICASFFLCTHNGYTSQKNESSNMLIEEEKSKQVIRDFLSLKFSYSGDELAEKIEKMKGELDHLKKEDIEEFLKENRKTSLEKNPKVYVTVYVPEKYDFNILKNNLIAAAYFPHEFDPRKKDPVYLYTLDHINKQISYAAYYGHPMPSSSLRDIANCYCLWDEHVFYSVISEIEKKSSEIKNQEFVIPLNIFNSQGNKDPLDFSLKEDHSREDEEKKNNYFMCLTHILEKGFIKK